MLGDLASLATAIGLAIAIWQLRQQQLLARAQFEESLVSRYWDILDRLTVEARLGRGQAFSEDDRRAAHSYFKLADEEIYLATKQKKIRPGTWATWQEGISSTMRREPFAGEWLRVCQDPRGQVEYADLFSFVQSEAGRGSP